ncbi:carboxylesterase family protein [Streptomyces yangpuensis]|uniref:carboxylesterase family protein n=1 Tax=Streptomyces yangpuensis TaxID=1648182 RepID=UPI0036346E40
MPGGFDFGAFHAGDVPYLFEDAAAQPRFTPAQRGLSAVMTGYWAAFARTSAPRGAGLPAWLPHRTDRPYAQSPAPERTGPVDYRREHRLAFWDGLSRRPGTRDCGGGMGSRQLCILPGELYLL